MPRAKKEKKVKGYSVERPNGEVEVFKTLKEAEDYTSRTPDAMEVKEA